MKFSSLSLVAKSLLLSMVLNLTLGLAVPGAALSVAPTGTMTCSAQSIFTSSTGVANNAITITSSGTEITAANDFFIRIPSSINARFDTSDTTVGIIQSSLGMTSTTVSYPVNNKTVKFDVTTNFASGENVQITGLSLLGDATTAASALVWATDNTTEGSATFSSTSGCTLAVTATDAAATLTLANAAVGATQNTTLTLTLSVAMAAMDTITFTAPNELNLTNLGSAVTGTLETTDSITCAASGQVVTCTTIAATFAGAGFTIIMTGITGAYVGTTDITDLAINDFSATPSGADINADSTVSVTNTTVGSLTAAYVTPTSNAPSTLTDSLIVLTASASIPQGGQIQVVYPSGFDLSGANAVANNVSNVDGTWAVNASGQILTLTQSGGTATEAGTFSLEVEGIRNPSTSGSTGTFALTTLTSSSASVQTGTAPAVTISSDVDVTISSSGPAAADIATGTRDAVFIDFTITTDSDVSFNNFPISIDTSSDSSDSNEGLLSSSGAANFTDIKITDADTGTVLWGPVDSTSFVTSLGGSTLIDESTDSDRVYYLYGDTLSLSAGDALNLSLSMDVRNDAGLDGMTVVPALALGTTYPEIEDGVGTVLSNSSTLVPTSSITSKTMTVRAPSLSVSLASTPVSGSNTYVKGSNDVPFVGFVFACGDASNCQVTDLTLGAYYDDDSTASVDFDSAADTSDHILGLTTILGSVWLEDGDGNVVAVSESINSSTFAVTYSSLGWSLDAGETEVLYVVGDLSTNAFTDGDADSTAEAEEIAFAIRSAANVTVEDIDGNSFNATASGSVTGTVNVPSGCISSSNCSGGPSTYVTTADSGSLTVAVDSSTAQEDIVVAGSGDVEISTFEFTSTREAFVVSDFSINNRQSGVSALELGDYDNNVNRITVEYEDEDDNVLQSHGTLVAGTAIFSGESLYVPADESATLTVFADLNSINSGLGTAGEFVDLVLTFNNFEAIAQTSGVSFDASKIATSRAAASDLDFGSITYTDGDGVFETDGAQNPTLTLGGTLTLTIDDSADDNNNKLPVGSILCVDDNDNATCSSEDIYIVTAWPSPTSGTEDGVTLLAVDDAGDDNYDDNDAILYALPGTGYFMETNLAYVYESDLTLTLNTASPSGSSSVRPRDDVFIFDMTAHDEEKIQIRKADYFIACFPGSGASVTDATNALVSVDVSSCEATSMESTGDSIHTISREDISDSSHVSFWFRWSDADASTTALEVSNLGVFTADANDGTEDNVQILSSTNIVGAPSYFVEDTWYFVKDIPMPAGTDTGDRLLGLYTVDGTALSSSDTFYLDRITAYNEKIEIDLSSDADFAVSVRPMRALLQESGTTVAVGYIDVVSIDSDGNGQVDATDGSTAVLTFLPRFSDIEIAQGTTETFTVLLASAVLLNEDSESDPLVLSMDYGSASEGAVTPGDVWWYEMNQTVQWMGAMPENTLNGNTLNY